MLLLVVFNLAIYVAVLFIAACIVVRTRSLTYIVEDNSHYDAHLFRPVEIIYTCSSDILAHVIHLILLITPPFLLPRKHSKTQQVFNCWIESRQFFLFAGALIKLNDLRLESFMVYLIVTFYKSNSSLF